MRGLNHSHMIYRALQQIFLTTTRSIFLIPSLLPPLTAALISIGKSPSFMGIMVNATARVVSLPTVTSWRYVPRLWAALHKLVSSFRSTRTLKWVKMEGRFFFKSHNKNLNRWKTYNADALYGIWDHWIIPWLWKSHVITYSWPTTIIKILSVEIKRCWLTCFNNFNSIRRDFAETYLLPLTLNHIF